MNAPFDAFLSAAAPRLTVPAPPVLKPLPVVLKGPAHIVTEPISRRTMRVGHVDYHDLTGMLARLLGR